MQILERDSLPLGGFAGLTEHRLVTDSRVFGRQPFKKVMQGLGQFVYLADARFNPGGETGMHPHKEIDVISVMVEGRVSHGGSLAHGENLETGDVQVQRAGGEGFSHNEINPEDRENRMIQIWALPETQGQPAGYKHYRPNALGRTRIYGGKHTQSETFDSCTVIEILRLGPGELVSLPGQSLSYITEGKVVFREQSPSLATPYLAQNGTLIRGENLQAQAETSCQLILVRMDT